MLLLVSIYCQSHREYKTPNYRENAGRQKLGISPIINAILPKFSGLFGQTNFVNKIGITHADCLLAI
ncbi:MAG: hypothetical protein HC778_06800 [Chamaesiphon sp. CSU_1_12]|nr:hypothetical protein [Chamaesiphon sp. CSU_1_12]